MKKINIKHFLIFIIGVVSILFTTSHLTAGELFADIDHDSRLESVQWKKFATTDMGDYYQMRMVDDNADLLWRGPKQISETNPYIFSSLHTGVSTPELLFDIDKDGYVELLAPEPQSDISPTYYRKLRWMGNYFEKLPSQALVMRDIRSNYFSWESLVRSNGIWVSKFVRVVKRDLVKADITYYDKNGVWKSGVALLRFTSKGAVVHRWIKPLSHTSSTDVPVAKKRIIGTVYELDPNGNGFLSLREKPRAKEIGRFYNGDRVEILNQNGKWYKIKDIKSRRIGWSHSNWIMVD